MIRSRSKTMFALLGFALVVGLARGAADREGQFLEGLLERRLFELAARHAEIRRDAQAGSPREQAAAVVDLIRTYALHAAHRRPEAREPLWAKAHQAAEEFQQAFPEHPRLTLVQFQRAMATLTRGELARLEAEVALNPNAALEEARQTIRDATRRLDALDAELQPQPMTRRDASPDLLTADERSALRQHVRLERARAARNQGLSYPAGSPDRLAALTQGLDQLARLLPETTTDEPFGQRVRLEAAIARRLLGDAPEAAVLLETLAGEAVDPETRLAARAEQVRLAIDAREFEKALELALPQTSAGAHPELDFAKLEALLALWKAGANRPPDEVQRSRDAAIRTVREIEQAHGTYWGRRAEIRLVAVGVERGSGNVEILRRAADDFFLKGKLDEAIATFDKAAATAREAGDGKDEFEFRYKAALIEQERQRFAAAAERFRRLSLDRQDHPHAAQAHRVAIVNEAQASKKEPTRRATYAQWLAEHLQLWPSSETGDSVRLWLGGVHEQDGRWQEAVVTYQGVPANGEQAAESTAGAERAWQALLSDQAARGEAVEPLARDAVRWFESAYLNESNQLVSAWTEIARQRLSAAARLRLQWLPGEAAVAATQLQAALDGEPPPNDAWRLEAQPLVLVAMGLAPARRAAALAAVDQLPALATSKLFWMADRLRGEGRSGTDGDRELARIRLALLERVPLAERSGLPTGLEWKRRRAIALYESGDVKNGLAELAELARAQPQDGAIQESYATMLLGSPDRTDWQRGLEQWRRVASRSEPRSARWFRAKLGVATAQKQLGDAAGAATLIRYLQATEDLSQSGLEREFRQLLQELPP